MKRGTPDHPKTLHLMVLLDVTQFAAVGLLEMMWHFVARYAAQGDIGKYPDSVIADRVGWKDEPEMLIHGLTEAGWLDPMDDLKERLWVHDWHEHSDDAADKYLAEHGLLYANGARPRRKASKNGGNGKKRKSRDSVATQSRPGREKSRLSRDSVGKSRASHTHTHTHTQSPPVVPQGDGEGEELPGGGEAEGDEIYRVLVGEGNPEANPDMRGLSYAQDLTVRRCFAAVKDKIPWLELAEDVSREATLFGEPIRSPGFVWKAAIQRWVDKSLEADGSEKEGGAPVGSAEYVPLSKREKR